MILEIAFATLLAYIAVGFAICYSAPWVRKRKEATVFAGLSLSDVRMRVRRMKLHAFRAAMVLGIVFLWPVFLIDEWRQRKALDLWGKEYEKANRGRGLTFDRM